MTHYLITHRYKVDRRIIYKELIAKGFTVQQSRIMRDWRVNIINKHLLQNNKQPLEHKTKINTKTIKMKPYKRKRIKMETIDIIFKKSKSYERFLMNCKSRGYTLHDIDNFLGLNKDDIIDNKGKNKFKLVKQR